MGKASYTKGKIGEQIAADYLKSTGYEILFRNFRGGSGEIDIIARKKGITYFVEVKSRKQGSMVSPVESISPNKKRRLKSAVMAWLAKHGRLDTPCSFLMVLIEMPQDNGRPKISTIEDFLD